MGNAKLFTKLLEQTKTDAKTIVALTKKVDAAEADAAARCRQAVNDVADLAAADRAKLVAEHKAAMDALQASHEEDWRAANKRQEILRDNLQAANEKCSKLRDDLDATKREVDNLMLIKTHQEGRIQELETQLDTIKPELELLDAKKAELTKMLDSVRDRLRRKEREEEQAILNRKAISRSAPGVNRR